MKRMINSDGLFKVINGCHYCGTRQNTPTIFSGMFRIPEKLIDTNGEYIEEDYIEIAICQKCFNKIDNDFNMIVKMTMDGLDA